MNTVENWPVVIPRTLRKVDKSTYVDESSIFNKHFSCHISNVCKVLQVYDEVETN